MSSSTARKRATYNDVLTAPRNMVAQVIGGELYLHPRPAAPHAAATTALGEELGPPFKRGRGGPGGWLILFEPELHLGPEPDIVVPDLAGWKRERMMAVPRAPFLSLSPDWVCEVLSLSTEGTDRAAKVPIYAREQVSWVWLVDPYVRTLEVLQLDGATYRILAVWRDDNAVKAPPFDAIELDLALLWIDVEPEPA